MKVAKSSTSVTQNYDSPNREALLLIAAGIHNVSRLALAITGNDVSGMSDELIIDLESRMEGGRYRKFFNPMRHNHRKIKSAYAISDN